MIQYCIIRDSYNLRQHDGSALVLEAKGLVARRTARGLDLGRLAAVRTEVFNVFTP